MKIEATVSKSARTLALAVVAVGLGAYSASAATIAFDSVFANVGFESGLTSYTVTRPNGNYDASTTINPVPAINPADPANDPTLLSAPAGANFTAVQNPGDDAIDNNLKLVHSAVAAPVYSAGDIFEVVLFGNKGRFEPYDTPASSGELFITLYGWNAGSLPTVTASTDDWSRNPAYSSTIEYDFAGQTDGTWGDQLIQFVPTAGLAYFSFSITLQNHNHDQYMAADLGSSSTQVPDGASTLQLLAGALLALGAVGRFARKQRG